MEMSWPERLRWLVRQIPDAVAFLADALTIAASLIAIYLFFTQRKAIVTVFHLLLGYAHQLTLSELKGKLDKLNDLRVADSAQLEEIAAVIGEITGQTRGNPRLGALEDLLKRINRQIEAGKLTEPAKRNFVAEFRERLRHIDVESFNSLSGDGQ